MSALSEEGQRQIEGLWRSHRVRQRAHAVRLSAKGDTLDQIADGLAVDREAVSRTLDRWERGGPGGGPPTRAAAQGGCRAGGGGTQRRPRAARQPAPHAGKKGALRLACYDTRQVKARRAEWRRRGLRRFFLPLYCPHLNRIETRWRLVKHRWLSPIAYATFATLREHVTALLNVVGLNYRVSFS